MKLTISKLGEPKDVQTKFGMKQKSYIKAQEEGDKFLSYWCGAQTEGWKVGDEIEVVEVKPREYNSKTYYDLVLPKMGGVDTSGLKVEIMAVRTEIQKVQTQLSMVIGHLSGRNKLDVTSAGTKVPDFSEINEPVNDINPDDIPF